MVATIDDSARLLVTIEATVNKYLKQMQQVTKASKDTATSIEKDFKRANDNAAKSFNSKAAVQSLGQTKAAAQNLSFQLNDIATQLAAGTSPFTIMAQQGGQVAQIINSTGGVRGAMTALGGAISSVLNPAGLLSVALIGITGYAVQYFAQMVSGGEASNKELEEHRKLVESVGKRWGDALPSLQKYLDELSKVKDLGELKQVEQSQLESVYASLERQVSDVRAELAALIIDLQQSGQDPQPIINLQNAFNDLYEKVKNNTATVEDLRRVQKELADQAGRTGIPTALAFANAIGTLADELERAAGAAGAVRRETAGVGAGITGYQTQGGPARYEGYDLPNSAPVPERRVDPYFDGPDAAKEKAAADRDAAKAAREAAKAYKDATSSTAFELIKGFEGFRNKPYWDVNAYRVGFGSDTITLADGSIQKVTQGMRVSVEDANRDLVRRIEQYQGVIQGQIGSGAWSSMNEQQQAALTSIAYNYGSLPERIVEAISSGSAASVEGAIRSLSGHNAGVNAGRRNREADVFSGASMDTGGFAGPWGSTLDLTKQNTLAAQQLTQQYQALGQIGQTALNGIVSALADGKIEANELLGILLDVVKQILSMPKIGGSVGGGGSILGSILGGFLGFDKGGYTGSGGRLQPAGVVHKGEYVFDQASVRRAGGPAALDAMRRGLKGYAAGGLVGPKSFRLPDIHTGRDSPRSSGGTFIINAPINAPGADKAELARLRAQVKELGRSIPAMVDQRTKERDSRGTRSSFNVRRTEWPG